MKLIVGLGNPGQKYILTRHNIGFLVIDAIQRAFQFPPFKNEHKSEVSKGSIGDTPCIIAKPQTFMNNSGEAVQALQAYYKIETDDILVIHDEVDQPFQSLKFQKARGHGGHNGIRDIHRLLGTNDYSRMRVGVGRPTKGDVASFVLTNFNNEEQNILNNEWLNVLVDAIEDFVEIGMEKTANKYN